MTAKRMRREFTAELKREAAALLRDSGRPLTQVASELAETQSVCGWGLAPPVLGRWRGLANGMGQALSAARPGAAAPPLAEQAEIRRLQKELERARMERDIPKKAVGIFSGPPR